MFFCAGLTVGIAILLCSIFPPALSVRVQTRMHVSNESTSNLSQTLEYARKVRIFARIPVFKAACESSAFTCSEIIQLASFDTAQVDEGLILWGPDWWEATVMVFAEGREHQGCISDPENGKAVVDAFSMKWQSRWSAEPEGLSLDEVHWNDQMNEVLDRLTRVFDTDKSDLVPATGVGAPPIQLQTGRRTDKDMKNLKKSLEKLMPNSFFYNEMSLFAKEFRAWLLHIRSHGEQFSGPQLVALVNAIPLGFGLAQTVSILLEHLEQFVTGVTCEEVNEIQRRMGIILTDQDYRVAGLAAIKSSIIDPQNKIAVVAEPRVQSLGMTPAQRTEEVLRDVVAGQPPKNNAIFGVVRGNPVIFVVDESDSMDATFTLGNDTLVRRNFCHSQLEMALKGLPEDTYFNVIQFDSFPVKTFEQPVLASTANIGLAMSKVSSVWRDDYTPEQDPVLWLRRVHGFSLQFKHQFRGSTTNLEETLELAYDTARLPFEVIEFPLVEVIAEVEESDDDTLHANGIPVVIPEMPQIYCLISARPDCGASQVLNKIDEFDDGRNIPVNSITFSSASPCPVTKQFGKSLARKTGGFFRSIEQA